MSYDYTNWPGPSDVRERVDGLGFRLRPVVGDPQIQQRIDALTARVQRETRRNFTLTTETRYFDGSGTGEQELDEYTEIDTVRIFGYLGVPAGVLVSSWEPVEVQAAPKTRIIIARGSLPAFAPVWLSVFPEGRRNVEITATYGYDVEIPADLWQSVLDATSALLGTESMMGPRGRISEVREGDEAVKFDARMPGELLGADDRLTDAIGRYKRPGAKRIRTAQPRMI